MKTTEYLRCLRCGAIYASRDVLGSPLARSALTNAIPDTLCLKCGGKVVWGESIERGNSGWIERMLFRVVIALVASAVLAVIIAIGLILAGRTTL